MEKDKSQNFSLNTNKKLALLSYCWVFCFVPILFSRDEFVKFHAKQGLVLFFVEVALVFVAWIPIIGWLLTVAVVIMTILGIKAVLNDEKWEMPYINKLAKKIKL